MSHEHPISAEELMAYADGQLQSDRTSQIGAHLETCPDCAKTIADTKGLSLQMAAWQVDEAPERLARSVSAALESRPRRHGDLASTLLAWMKGRTLAYSLAGAVVVATVVSTSLVLRYREMRSYKSEMIAGLSAPEEIPRTGPFPATPPPPAGPPTLAEEFSLEQSGQNGQMGQQVKLPQSPSNPTTGPMIIRSVQLTLVTKSFDSMRTRIEAIVQDSKGYVDSLSVRSEPKSPKSLSAVLRIPDDKLAASLIELRKLGQPKEESQSSADITGQYVDLVARLSNARNTEQRLLALLRERTGTLKDVVAAEGEISRVREQIERMEVERKNFDNKVQYATIHVEVAEEYRAELQPPATNTGTRIHNAAVEGYETASDTILGIALTVLANGPAVLVWLMFLSSVGFIVRKLYVLIRARRLAQNFR